MPTLLELIGEKSEQKFDGISFVPTLFAKDDTEVQPDRPFLYRESPGYGAQQTVIVGDWKIVRKNMRQAGKSGKTPDEVEVELYDLATDPGETTNLSGGHPEKVAELKKFMETQHVRSPVFPMPLLDD